MISKRRLISDWIASTELCRSDTRFIPSVNFASANFQFASHSSNRDIRFSANRSSFERSSTLSTNSVSFFVRLPAVVSCAVSFVV